jgi:nicotinamidase/pyrazinamidase
VIGALVVDIQGDFTQLMNGPLAVPGTNLDYIHKINKAIGQLKGLGIPLWASQDWHPADHVSFFTNHPGEKVFDRITTLQGKEQILWPPHCLQGTPGAELLIDRSLFETVVQKGRDQRYDSYSCFQDEGGRETELDGLLKGRGLKKLLIFGIATDYCVRWTSLDGLERGYGILVVKSLCRGVDQKTSDQAMIEIKQKGIVILEDLETFLALQS